MQWLYQNIPVQELPDNCVGFVYLITNTANGKMYIGKKLARFKTLRYKMHTQKNGKKIRKRIRGAVPSDWQDYYGSSDALNADIEQLGKDKFVREILYYCQSKAECNYIEAREQFDRRVLESSMYYNGHIRVRVHGKTLLKKE
jgi:predicted GIY-YIG superfamily endonuclease